MRYGITEVIYRNIYTSTYCIKKNYWLYSWAYILCSTKWGWRIIKPETTKTSNNRLDFISKDNNFHYEELCQECLVKLPRKLHNKIKYNFIVAKLKS